MSKTEPFGQITIRMGFATASQVQAALEVQDSLRRTGKPRLIGMIMLEMGMISSDQLIEVLKYYEVLAVVRQHATPEAGARSAVN